MWPFSKRVEKPEPKMQTLGEMIAFSLKNEATRTTWKAANSEKHLVSKDLGITLDCRWHRSTYCYGVKRANGHEVPLPEKDKNLISEGIRSWREWDDERKRANALVSFVERFERTYGTNA